MNRAANVDTSATAQAADSQIHPVLDRVETGLSRSALAPLMPQPSSPQRNACSCQLACDGHNGHGLGAGTDLEAASARAPPASSKVALGGAAQSAPERPDSGSGASTTMARRQRTPQSLVAGEGLPKPRGSGSRYAIRLRKRRCTIGSHGARQVGQHPAAPRQRQQRFRPKVRTPSAAPCAPACSCS